MARSPSMRAQLIAITRRGKEISRDIQVNELKERQPSDKDVIQAKGADIAWRLPDNGNK